MSRRTGSSRRRAGDEGVLRDELETKVFSESSWSQRCSPRRTGVKDVLRDELEVKELSEMSWMPWSLYRRDKAQEVFYC